MSAAEEFRAAIAATGIEPPDHIIADGERHRFSSSGKRGDDSGWYRFWNDDRPAGVFGCWRSSLNEKWHADTKREFTPAERAAWKAKVERDAQERAAEEAERNAQAAARARKMWDRGTPANGHAYLERKGVAGEIAADCAKELDGELLIPVRRAKHDMVGLQIIDAEGGKLFLPGTPVEENYTPIGVASKNVAIVEGFVTGVSVCEATGRYVIVAFDAGNLPKVAEKIRKAMPDADIVIAGDDDAFTVRPKNHPQAGQPWNPGREAAEKAAKAIGARAVFPAWSGERGRGTDFNDLAAVEGREAVAACFRAPIEPRKSAFGFRPVGDMLQHLKPIDWLVKGYFEADSLALLFGDPGCGKSFVAVDVACAIATGSAWQGNQTKKGAVFYIAGEGHNGLARRFKAWEIASGVPLADAPLFVSHRAASLSSAESADTVGQAIDELAQATGQSPRLVVIDTLARNFGAADENSTADMNSFVTNLDAYMKDKFKACVLIVHHTGHADKSRARGAMALKGALDAEYQLERDEAGMIRLSATKMKDADHPEPLAFRIETIELPFSDEDGGRVHGAALRSTSYAPPPKAGKAGRGKHQTTALQALDDLEREHRDNLEAAGKDPREAMVKIESWENRLIRDHAMPRQRLYDVRTSLVELGLVEMLSGGYVRRI